VSNRLEPHRENAKGSPSMSHTDMSIPALLREQATVHGDATAYTFMDGAVLGTGHPESLSWAQVYRRGRCQL